MVATVVTKASNTISKLERSATKRSASNNNSRPTTTDVVGAYNNDTLFGRKIEIASEGLS